jgi:hypothetical protein
MTEAEWLACTDPQRMLEFLRSKASERKLRLFACACCRRIWHLLSDERSRQAVEVTERVADGLASPIELEAAQADARNAIPGRNPSRGASPGTRAWRVAVVNHSGAGAAWYTVSFPACACHVASLTASVAGMRGLSWEQEPRHWQCGLALDIFGNPFRPMVLDESWLTAIVTSITSLIYEERAFDRLPILADALEDAGCTNEDLLTHCRQHGEHVRGCWVLDLLLGKS